MARYHQPRTLDHALQLLAADPGLTVLAGATDVYPAKTARAGWGHVSELGILDLTGIQRYADIGERADHWSIGALTTWSAIASAPLPQLFDGLKAAAREIGGVQIQNRGTIGGNICTASPAGDAIPCLLALDAEVQLASAAEDRRMPLSAFIDGYRHTALRPGELVESIRVPKQPGTGHFLKLGARQYLVISIAMVAGVIDLDGATGVIRSAKIAVGACSAVAQRLRGLEAELTGTRPGAVHVSDAHLAQLAPLDDVRGSAAYRRAAARQLVADLLAGLQRRRSS